MQYTSVHLSRSELFTHYSIVPFFGIIAIAGWVGAARTMNDSFLLGLAASGSLLTWLAYRMQRRALRFVRYRTNHDAVLNHQLVLALADADDCWVVAEDVAPSRIVFSVLGFPRSLLSWGERVTVCFDGTDVYVNSICDPQRGRSVATYGRNRRNVRTVADAVRGFSSRPN